MNGHTGVWVALIVLAASALFIFFPLAFTGFFVSVTGENASLSLWDSADSHGGSYKVYADGSPLGSGPSSTTLPIFFANYTNLTSGESINGSGIECNISFNISGGWTSSVNMWFNSSSLLYEYNKSFASRGFYYWNVTCDGSSQNYDMLNTTDNITVFNTPAGIYVPLADKNCSEDTACQHDFSADCYDIDDIDENNLIYSYVSGTEFNGFGINSATGAITVDVTSDSGCGEFEVSLTVQDPEGDGSVANKTFIVNAVNDEPNLQNLPSSSYQNSSFYNDIDATDDETPSGPFFFNITFLECYRPFNSEHTNLTECSNLFTINNATGEINRTSNFTNLDVGEYTINYTVTDPGDNLTGTSTPPYTWLANETGWQVENFSVTDINDLPVIDPVPDQFWAQNENRILIINASDIDNGTLVFNTTTLYRNLSVYPNSSLFPITF
ncbi:MAG: cadherin repeat domain-containing protein, partial [Candidatus Aenigmarchaeota archaeon]|nr:cadherin repeat domain-containing protein [Candidatus Aenigmarchaeota archaeon]